MVKIIPGLDIDGYVLGQEIGHGGMGAVWRAYEPLLMREVAVKLIAADAADSEVTRQRFILEARAGAAIDHPNVVQVYAVGEIEDVLYIAMQLIEGPSLSEILDREAWAEAARAVAIVCQIANALEVAHERGLVHRDVKPSNILLQTLGGVEHAYLADFGLARFTAASRMTRAGAVIGTPAYMAPEQVRGDPVDGRADIYALGCVLHRTLTGEVPFPRPLVHEVYAAHLHADAPAPSSVNSLVDPAFDSVVLEALAKAPGDRFASCSAFEKACREALGRSVRETPSEETMERLEIAVPEDVLVWQQGDGRPLIHRNGECPVLVGSIVPPQAVKFAGSGTAGWLPFGEAVAEADAALCALCIGGSA
jgi:serine/threonine protein kinase